MFSDQTIFTLQFTNVAAALFFALANVCFSWSRSLKDERHELSIRRLNRVSFACIFTSIFFVFTSFSNYIVLTAEQKGINVNINPVYLAVMGAKFITLIIALILMFCTIYQLFREGWHLFIYEYALISDIGEDDSRNEIIPKRLRRYDKKERLLNCIRKNEFHEEKMENSLKFTKGNVEIRFQDKIALSFMYVIIKHNDGRGLIEDIISTSNINTVNGAIKRCRNEHGGDPNDLQDLIYTEDLLN